VEGSLIKSGGGLFQISGSSPRGRDGVFYGRKEKTPQQIKAANSISNLSLKANSYWTSNIVADFD